MTEETKNMLVEGSECIIAYNAAAKSAPFGVSIGEDIDTVEDREVNFVLSRDDSGCDIAYNQITAVKSAVRKVVSAYNTGIIVNSVDANKFSDDIKYLEEMKDELEIDRFITTCLTGRELYGVGAIGKSNDGTNITHLVDISTKDDTGYKFKLIVNSMTGRLGLTNVDPENPTKEVIAIQKANIQNYDSEGNTTDGDKISTYFIDETLMVLGNYELGRVRGTSSVFSILRYAEGLVRLENTVSLLARRPTQLVYIAGNEKFNLLNCKIPQSYVTAAKGDMPTAKIAYKTERLTALNKEAKKLADGNVLAQVLEYGTDMKAIEMPEGLPYMDYIQWYAQQITTGITGIDKIEKRVVRSREQEAKFQAELTNRGKQEQRLIKIWLNKHLTKQLLKGREATINDVWYDFDPVEIDDKERISRIWMNISTAVKNFAQGGVQIPEGLLELMGVEELPITKPESPMSEEIGKV